MATEFRDLNVEIVRSEKTRIIRAYIVQQAADGPKKGKNILYRRNIMRIETAKKRVIDILAGKGLTCELYDWSTLAAPDLVRKKKAKPVVDSTVEDKPAWE